MKKFASMTIVALVIVIALLVFTPQPAYAAPVLDGEGPGELSGAFDDVLVFLRGIAQSVIKFLISIGGVIFTVGFVWSAARGSLGQAIGNTLQTSKAVVGAISAVFAFIFLLSSFRIGTYLSVTITDRFISPDKFVMLDASELASGDGGGVGDVAPEDVLQSPEIVEVITDFAVAVVRFMIGLGSLAFFVALVRGAFDAQLGSLLGGGQMASAGISRAFGAVAAFLFLIASYSLSQTLISTLVPRLLSKVVIPM